MGAERQVCSIAQGKEKKNLPIKYTKHPKEKAQDLGRLKQGNQKKSLALHHQS